MSDIRLITVSLERFIEDNAGKVPGKSIFKCGQLLLNTRFVMGENYGVCDTVEVHVEVAALGWFTDCFVNKEVKSITDFYNWLDTSFFPLLRKRKIKQCGELYLSETNKEEREN